MKAEQLRKSILQLAIQGKLAPQDPNDEPASVLLERIRAEKQKLIKEGKIKKDKNDSVIFKGEDNRYYEKVGSGVKDITDDLPFEIPDSWCFTRFSFFIRINCGYAFKSENYIDKENGIRVLRISDFNEDGFNQKRPVYHKYTPALKSFELEINDIIMCMTGGTVGKSYFVTELPEPMLVNQRVADIKINNKINKKYCYYFILSPYIQKIIAESKNSTNDNISVGLINSFVIPIPPLAEQSRIVFEIEKYEPLIAEYDKLEQQATKLDDEIYDKLKKSILQYAIQGKLVPQDPNDEPASVLLERIRAEKKAKLGKKYVGSYIYKGDDNCYYEHITGRAQDEPVEVPFDIPDNWKWSKIKYIADTQTGTTPSTSDKSNFGDYISFVKPGDLVNGRILYNREMLSERGLNNGRLIPSNSVIMVCIGGSTGKCALTDRDISCNQQINTASPCKWVLPQYLFFFMTSDYFYKTVRANATGTATPIINRSTWDNLVIPIPPLAEQKRIVAKINEIFAML